MMTWLTVPKWLVVFFLVMVTFHPHLASSSSRAKVSYADHCGATVPSSTPTTIFFDNPTNLIPLYTGFFSNGDDLLNADPDPSSSSVHGSFNFFVQNYYLTRTPGIIKLDASMSFVGQNVRFTRRKELYFQLSGFWSKNSGQVCMVGSASYREGNVRILYAVFKLKYPQSSNISTSLVRGTFERLDVSDSTYHFDPVSILAYIQHNYSYTKIPQAVDTCIRDNVPEESLGVDHCTVCNNIKRMLWQGTFELDRGRGGCNDRYCGPPGFPTIFMNLNQIQCTENGKVHMHIGFSNDTYAGSDLFPHTSLISEGFWDSDENRLCLVACPITRDFTVGNCTIGLSLWFPAVLSITSRSTVVGRMWSTKDETEPDYFSTISFRGFVSNNAVLPGIRYEYTRTDSARGYCKNEDIGNVDNASYTDGDFIGDLGFQLSVRISEGNTVTAYASLLSLGETFYGSSYRASPVDLLLDSTLEETSSSLRNVSYRISYSSFDTLLERTTFTVISAEGVYDTRTGTLFLIGCRDPCSFDLDQKLKYDCSLDCEILITIQLSPSKDGRSRRSLNGTIQSTREMSHPLYFEPLEVSSHNTYERAEQQRAAQSIWRMDTDMIVVIVSLALSCIFVQVQMSYAKKRPEVLPSMSMLMLLELTLGHLLSLVLNFEASFSGKRSREDAKLGSEWLEANEVTLRVMIMSAFIMQLRLLQWAVSARSLHKDRKSLWAADKKIARFYLLTSILGPLTSLFGNISSYVTRSEWPLYVAEYKPYAGLVRDGFLIPQILLNFVRSSTDKSLSLVFCIGMTVTLALPRLYDAYRAGYFAPYIGGSSTSSASAFGTFSSSSWCTGIPLQEVLLVVLVFFQQQFGGRFFLPKRFRKLHRS